MAGALDAEESENIPKELLNNLLSEKVKKEGGNDKPKLISFWLPLAAAACVAVVYYTNSNDREAQLVEEITKGDFKTTESSPFADLNLEEEDVFAMVEFGVWKEDLLRGGNEESKENFPEGVRKVQLEKKIDWEMWKADKSVKYKVWIDEDYGTVKILTTESGQIETKQLNLLDDSQSSELQEILKKLIQGIEK